MMTQKAGSFFVACAALLVACSAADDRLGPPGSGLTGGSSGAGGELDLTTTGAGGDIGGGCSEAATLVYVLSTDNELYRFSPPDKAFQKIGSLGCQTAMQPNSMAVDRTATAWVNYVDSDGVSDVGAALFKVSTKDAACEGPVMTLGDPWLRLGMGFSASLAGGEGEGLFVSGTDGFGASPGIARVDTSALSLSPVGSFTGSLAGANAELTGTGDGRLFGFFTTTPVQVAEIDEQTGAIVSQTALPTVETPAAWAFTFWGGDFYLYTAPDASLEPLRTTNVTRYRPSDGSVDTAYMTDIGFVIVGAGVSTCAPVEAPK